MKLRFLPREPGYHFRHLSCWWRSGSACGTAMPRKAEQGCRGHVSRQFLPCIPEMANSLLLTVVRVWPKTEICCEYWFKLLHKSWILSFSSSRMLCEGWKMRLDQPTVIQNWSHPLSTNTTKKVWVSRPVCASWLHYIHIVEGGSFPGQECDLMSVLFHLPLGSI